MTWRLVIRFVKRWDCTMMKITTTKIKMIALWRKLARIGLVLKTP